MFESVLIVLLFVPLILILILANLADESRQAGTSEKVFVRLTYLLNVLVFGGLATIGVLLQIFKLLLNIADSWAESVYDEILSRGIAQSEGLLIVLDKLDIIGVSLWAPALAGSLLLLPPVRHFLAKLIPIDPRSAVHAVSLSFVMLAIISLTVTLAVGLETLADISEEAPNDNLASMLVSVWTQQLTFVLLGLVGVGWLTRRKWLASWERLAVVMPRPIEIAIGLGAGLLFLGVVFLLEIVASAVGLGFDENVERLTEALIGPLALSLPGILTIGLAAGIGEETLFRGALQPRFGLLFTSLLFALFHSNYGITLSTLAVLILGLGLGLLRIRFNTTTCAIAHASYNIAVGVTPFLLP